LIECSEVVAQRAEQAIPKKNLKLMYIGRIDWTKGLHIAIDALRLLPRAELELEIYGEVVDAEYGHLIRQLAAQDRRISLKGAIAPQQVREKFAAADAAIIPSLWLETGPLTVLEAHAAGTPIIASRLGGIAELCRDGMGTRLFAPNNARELSSIIAEFAAQPHKLEEVRRSIPVPKSMSQVAREMADLYKTVGE
jgi:glycosyltransferase involved in cell wall biosynthesis